MRILIPTDFSECSSHAIEAAFYISKKLKGSVHLLHVIEGEVGGEFNVTGPSGSGNPEDDIYMGLLIGETKKRMQYVLDTPGLEEIAVTSDIKMGKPSKVIDEHIESGEYDLVVMGTLGASGFQELTAGSNTQKVVRKSSIPVLAVKNLVKENDFENVVFASSLSAEDNIGGNVTLSNIVEAFNSKVNFLRVNTPNNFQTDWNTRKQMTKYADKYELPNATYNIYNDTIEEDGIISFANEIDAGMIIMATHGRTGIARFLSGSIAEDVVNHSEKPVLTVKLNQ